MRMCWGDNKVFDAVVFRKFTVFSSAGNVEYKYKAKQVQGLKYSKTKQLTES